jgi:xenotropic and polytropic retrovirus receptor 1
MPHLFSDIEYTVCYYATGSFIKADSELCDGVVNILLPYTMAAPFWWRFWQCSRRLYFTGDVEHFANAMKYFLSLSGHVVVAVHRNYSASGGDFTPPRLAWIIFYIIAVGYLYYWDMAMDWGLLRRDGAAFALRKKIMFRPGWYYLAIFLDGIARFHWVWGLTVYQVPMNGAYRTWIFDFVEILRRSMWGIFRMENEHLNNCGHFRATVEVPLPIEQDLFDQSQKPLVKVLSSKVRNLRRRQAPKGPVNLHRD